MAGLELFTSENVIPDSHSANFEGQWIILNLKWSVAQGYMKAEYCNSKNQLYYAKSGFGCDPHKMGRKIFGTFAADFDSGYIVCREEVLGIATPETIETWKAMYPDCADHVRQIETGEY